MTLRHVTSRHVAVRQDRCRAELLHQCADRNDITARSWTDAGQQALSVKIRRMRRTLKSKAQEYIYYSYARLAQKSINQLFIKTSSSEERNCQKAATSGPHIVSKKPSTLNTDSWIKISVSVSRRSPACWQKRSPSAECLSVNSSERHTKHSHNLSHRNCLLYTILNAIH